MYHSPERRAVLLWQFAFIVLSLAWLWAPWLNPDLSAHISAISQFEATDQPFSLLFRSASVLAAMLLIGMAAHLTKRLSSPGKYFVMIVLLVASIGMFFDALLPTRCLLFHHYCTAIPSPVSHVHGYGSFVVYGSLLTLTLHDAVTRRKNPSIAAAFVQSMFGFYVLAGIVALARYSTLSQFIYQFTVTIWIAWFCRDVLIKKQAPPHEKPTPLIRYGMAAWVFLMGVATILLGLTGGRFAFHAHALYLTDGAWLAQHGVIIGVILLYIGRHLLRGELRARQIVLAVFGVEIIAYAIITPHPSLLYLYLIGFATLFVLKDSFNRGTSPLTWTIRLRDLLFLLSGLVISASLAALVIAHRAEAGRFASDVFTHFTDIVFRNTSHPVIYRRAELLFSDTFSVFIVAIVVGVIWILFKPSVRPKLASTAERESARLLLEDYGNSSEDFFKLWPYDKSYFWDETGTTFIAYRQVGSVAYMLADPIGPHTAALLASFQEYCRSERLKLACLPVYIQSQQMYSAHGLSLLQVGASAIIRIDAFADTTVRDKWWRWQRNRGAKKGYSHRTSVPPHSDSLLGKLKTVSDAWLAKDGHAERGFALGYFDTAYLSQCTLHYLVDAQENVIAFVNILPSLRPSHTATIDLLRFLPDHDGAMPYLLCETILFLKKHSDSKTFDLGFVPFASTDNRIVQIAKLIGGKRFSSKGLEQFKNKFDPIWEPNYLAYDGDLADLTQVAASLERAMKLPKTTHKQRD